MFKRNWHNDESRSKNNGHTWAEYTPYSNALWIKYLFKWLRTAYLKAIAPMDDSAQWYLTEGINKLRRKLDVRTKNGAFGSATDVLVFAVEQGWITEEQMESHGVDSSILSQ
jgi:serine/threonine-protein kinase haspin